MVQRLISATEGPRVTQSIEAGTSWTYRAPSGYEASRIIVGAIVRFQDEPDIACVSVLDAPQRRADGSIVPRTIPLLPMTLTAFSQTVLRQDGHIPAPPEFMPAFEAWHEDGRGLTYFTVPFDGHLDRMIARQMAAISLEQSA